MEARPDEQEVAAVCPGAVDPGPFALIPPGRYGPASTGPCGGLGSGVADIFDEINEDLRAERMRAFARRYGWLAVALLLLVLGAVGGVQLWRWYQDRAAGAVAVQFTAASRQAAGVGANASSQLAVPQFERLAASSPKGYRTLARFRLAALKADGRDLPAALGLWDEIARDSSADPDLRGLANLLWAQRQLDTGDPASVAARLGPLADQNNTWHALAQEAQALLALRQNDAGQARALFTRLTADATAPDNLRQRAALMLSLTGAAEPAK